MNTHTYIAQVFLEFVANDGSEMDVTLDNTEKTRSFELLMRKVLKQQASPAVVMMQVRVRRRSSRSKP